MQGQFPSSIWMPTDQFWQGRSGHKPRYIIVHGTAWPGPATAQDIAKFFQHPDRPTSTHYVIGKDGTIVQCVREEDAAWGNGILSAGHDPWWGTRGNPNFETISIEHVKWQGTTHNDEGLTEAQWEASFALINYLCSKWNIPRSKADQAGGITGHFSIDPVNRKYCPGPYPWNDLFDALNRPGSPAGFSPSGASVAASSLPYSGRANEQGSYDPNLPGPKGSAAHPLSDVPGFLGLTLSLNQAMQFSGFDATQPGSFVAGNMGTLMLRTIVTVLGVALLLLLIAALVRGNDWIGRAGSDTLPLMMHAGDSKTAAERLGGHT